MNAISVRLEPLKLENIKHQKEHDERKYPPSKMPKYIDKTRTHLNSVIIQSKSEQEIIDEIERRRDKANKKQKQKLKKNATILYSGIITFGTEAQSVIESLTKQEQDKLFYDVAKAVSDYLNTDLESLNIHRDETAIHAHFTIYAYDRNGEPLTRKVKPDTLSRIQDIAAEKVKHLGINRGMRKYERIQRGDDYVKVIHRSVRELHRDLPKEIEKKKQEISILENKITELKSVFSKFAHETQQKKQQMEQQINEYQRQVNELKMSIDNLQKTKQRIQQEIMQEQQKQDEMRKKKQQLIEELNRLLQERQLLDAELKQRQEKLKELDKITRELQNQIQEKQKELEQMKEHFQEYDIQGMLQEIEELRKTVAIDDEYIYATAKYFQTAEPDVYEKLTKRFSWIPDFLQEIEYEKSQKKQNIQQKKVNYPNLNM